jgi:hypothetical protein
MTKYLLPCQCGQNVEVDAGQAGLTVSCACGAALEVPTMRGLAALAVVETAQPSETSAGSDAAWGPGQALQFLGAIATICGVLALGLVLRTRPQWIVHSEQISVAVDRLTTAQLWERWQDLRKGLGTADDPVRQRFETDWATFRRRRTMAAIPLVAGIVLLAAGYLLRKSSST